jgi:hypothetical protein
MRSQRNIRERFLLSRWNEWNREAPRQHLYFSNNAIYGRFPPTVKGTFFTRAHDIIGTEEYNRYHLHMSRKVARRKARHETA